MKANLTTKEVAHTDIFIVEKRYKRGDPKNIKSIYAMLHTITKFATTIINSHADVLKCEASKERSEIIKPKDSWQRL